MSHIFKSQRENIDTAAFKTIQAEDKSPLIFEKVLATIIQPSVIAIAVGKKNDDGLPMILGTAFCISDNNENDGVNTNTFVTCDHVIELLKQIKNLDSEQLTKEGLVDNKTRIAKPCRQKDGSQYWEWHELSEPIKSLSMIEEDCSILQMPSDITLPPLSLSPELPLWGNEVGILGFPTSGSLQEGSIQPFVIKTIISSIINYKFSRSLPKDGTEDCEEIIYEEKVITRPRMALSHSLADGFSGSPVFSISSNGLVVGMVDYTPFCEEEFYLKFNTKDGKSIDGITYGKYPTSISLAVPVNSIKYNLDHFDHYKNMAKNKDIERCK
jgi:hypothetical protein